MFVPVLFSGESLGNDIVKVGIVGKDDVAADVEEETFGCDVCRCQTAGFMVCVDEQPGGVVL